MIAVENFNAFMFSSSQKKHSNTNTFDLVIYSEGQDNCFLVSIIIQFG